MRMSQATWIFVTLALLGATPVAAGEVPLPETTDEASLELLANTLRVNRKAMVSVNLPLPEDQAAKFWPLYDRYAAETGAIRERLTVLVDEYIATFRDMSQEDAGRLLEGYLDVEADYATVRSRWRGRFREVLPARTALRFYQIENKMDAVIRYHAARAIPVLEE